MRNLAQQAGASGRWSIVGWMGVLAGILILSYYAVIAGWALNYVWLTGSGALAETSAQVATSTFEQLQQDPLQMVGWHSLFMFFTIWIVARGVSRGLETAIRWFMPLLFVLLLVLLGYSASSGGFAQGWAFMFDFNWEVVGPETWLIAMGQAFFTLSLGMGTMMAYGAYVPDDSNIGSTVLTIVALDTFVAVAAGLAIFPLVFVNGLEVGQGPGLMFVTLPLAFGQLPMGALFGTVFFVLVSFAAITSAISLTEPAIAFVVEEYNAKRSRVAVSLGVFCWLLGLGTVFSFNIWADVKPLFGMNFFELVDQLSQNIMLPLGGLLIALFAVWVLPQNIVREQLEVTSERVMLLWRIVGGVIAPLGVAAVFVYTLLPLFMS
jgi:NSS family neurotransmitter:Na+ symporter